MEKEINIQGIEDMNMISPWERYEYLDKFTKRKRPLTLYIFLEMCQYI